MRDRAGLDARLVRRARVKPEYVALEVGVRIGVGIPGGGAIRVGRQRLPVGPQSLPEGELDALVVPLAAREGRDDEVRLGEGVVAEVVETKEERLG